MEKHIQMNSLASNYNNFTARVEDLKWIMTESKNLYEYFLEDFGRSNYIKDENANIKLL